MRCEFPGTRAPRAVSRIFGPGYARAPKSVVGEPGDDIEQYAAEHRLLCYQRYAGDLPSDGGMPALTRAEAERRARLRAKEPGTATRVLELLHNASLDRCVRLLLTSSPDLGAARLLTSEPLGDSRCAAAHEAVS